MRLFAWGIAISTSVVCGVRIEKWDGAMAQNGSAGSTGDVCPGVELFNMIKKLQGCVYDENSEVCKQYNSAEGAPPAYTYDTLDQTNTYFRTYAPTLTKISDSLLENGLSTTGLSGLFASIPNTQMQGGFPFESGEVAWILKTTIPKMDSYASNYFAELESGNVTAHLPKLKEIFANGWYNYSVNLIDGADNNYMSRAAKHWQYMRAMNYLFIGQWLGLWTPTALKLNRLSYTALELAMNHSDKYTMTWHEIPYVTDSGRSVFLKAAHFENKHYRAKTGLLLNACGGLDWTTPGHLPWVQPMLDDGISILMYEGPGQGLTIRELHVPFTPNWARVVGAVATYAKKHIRYNKKYGMSHGSQSFAGFLGAQVMVSNLPELKDVKMAYSSPTYPSASKVLMYIVWSLGYQIVKVTNYLKHNQKEFYEKHKEILTNYETWNQDGQNNVFGPDPIVAAIKDCDRLDVLSESKNSPLLLMGNVLYDQHAQYWTYTVGIDYAKSIGIDKVEDIFYNETNNKLVCAWAWEQIALKYQMTQEEAAETPEYRKILMMGTQEDVMMAEITIDSFAKAASRDGASSNIYTSRWDAATGGSGHCREGAPVKSFFNAVSPFLRDKKIPSRN
uniref:Uncharacterized protein n=1 Tax=Mucochytrium quahogii TaxID=96639 RepID=A0A7S2WAH0_9STRA|mmetsp:Transcript_20955/g.34152  ORF Transcript_20955/g.34152 Transcript_20955/m.34152 type:complete len:617 (-) Transcript_20955:161-2011(-)|eukprot:CAMPEP_0203753320 /NCGR_PEP_ID=MMETSP0098-20131031/7106_1 /ASSEMBLY_ACC=CAM_ASM_000208 /TAXON_ID=96639 /ORGANISM=" , Strain NY0313808BC1" /LENGTH=616 /DNA_ID=CAMNT_0050643865 /DNA_START=44 /DNA_END=1894 /DNA_ORIENTATION=+